MDQPNIVLTGFMGTGKSTVGRILAMETGREFVDTDIMIESEHGPIHQIFDEHGEQHFRELERRTADDLAQRSGLVIATGGRLMLDPLNIAALRDARVFTLIADAGEILRRISGGEGPRRPLLEVEDPLARIESLLAERRSGYELFPRIRSGGRTPEAVAGEIADLVGRGVSLLARDGASIALGVGIAAGWRTVLGLSGHTGVSYASDAARRLQPLIGPPESGEGGPSLMIGGLPSLDVSLFLPTELSTLLWWATHPATNARALFDVGLMQDDHAGMFMLDQYLSEMVETSVPSWSDGVGDAPNLLAWQLDAIEAVCRRAGFGSH